MEFNKGDLARITEDHGGVQAGDATIIIEGPHPSHTISGLYMRAHYLANHPTWADRTFNVYSYHIEHV